MGLIRNTLNWYSRLSPKRGIPKPPYNHVTQIGDPILRRLSEPVDINMIRSDTIATVIKRLKDVLNAYNSFGISAPQIGVNVRIFAVQFKEKQVKIMDPKLIKSLQIKPIPLTVYVNPKMKVLDYTKFSYTEGCESVKGYAADVPRFKAVEITGFDENGNEQINKIEGWGARIVQHELDHLDGKLYIDIMDRKTFYCTCWEEVNLSKGNVKIPFYPE